MASKSYWRRAVLVSWIIHCIFLAGAGWLNGKLFAVPNMPEDIELELISDITSPEQAANNPAEQPAVTPAASPVIPKTAQLVQPAVKAVSSDAVVDNVADNVVSEPSGSPTNGQAVPAMTALPGGAGTTAAVFGTGSGRSGRISPPRVLSKVEPAYPEEARQDGFSGTVAVRIEILENGRPGQIRVERSSGREALDAAALEAVRKWRFVPAQDVDSGRAVRCYTTLSVVFRLR
ncbi:hypothetical protein SCACP_06030 [Sporomusa carbonis]|uniref:energy transducer TonB n=1 Tax=Sporomusa carbonis TaxID=3076075 RepID=UPI003A6DE887